MINKAVKAVIDKEKPKESSKKPRFREKFGIPNFIASKKNFFTSPLGNRPERYKERALPKTPLIKIKIIINVFLFCILPPL